MNASVKTLVDRGLELRARIKVSQAELKEIEALLEKAGYQANVAGDVEELKDADREGRRWLAHGSDRVIPVIFTADKLVGSFALGSPLHQKISVAAGDHMNTFFKRSITFENRFDNGKKFRTIAAEVLGDGGPAFVTACLSRDKNGMPKSDVKIEWDKSEVVAP